MKGLEGGESVSLAEGFFGNETELDINGKLCLAVVLSYSLLDFCVEPWFPDGWTKNGIYLLQHSGHLLLRPNLVTYLRPTPKCSQPSSVSDDLKLLFHGILLIEIFKQAPLPLQMNLGKDIDIDDLRKMARKEFDTVKWGVCERFRQAVEACIEGDQGDQLDTPEDPKESFVTTFCTRVINPLETDFTSLWGDRDPDQVLSELKLPSIKRKKPPPRGPKPVHLKVSSLFDVRLVEPWLTVTDPTRKTCSTNKSKAFDTYAFESGHSCFERGTATNQILRCC
jgi:hypothetical protein